VRPSPIPIFLASFNSNFLTPMLNLMMAILLAGSVFGQAFNFSSGIAEGWILEGAYSFNCHGPWVSCSTYNYSFSLGRYDSPEYNSEAGLVKLRLSE